MNHRSGKPVVPRRRGTVLIVTIWVVLVLAGLALVLGRATRVGMIVSANQVASLNVECAAAGALAYVQAKLSSDEESLALQSSLPYEKMQVGGGYFWVLRPNLEDDRQRDYGLTDEAGKINLNSAPLEVLLKLPGMTAELAASIIDWRDADDEISPGGAESEYYLLLEEPYNCKNGPLETVEEVLLIKGATEDILYGEDTNLNGVLDDNENDADASDPPDNRDGRLEPGFYDYVTVYSVEPNTDSAGGERINITNRDNSQLAAKIREVVDEERYVDIMNFMDSMNNPRNIIDFYYRSGLEIEEFEQIADSLTTTDEEVLRGLVNVNTAPKEVLMCLPGLEESDAEALVSYRKSNDGLDSIAWVTKVLDQDKAVAIGGAITTRSFQYSADIVAAAADGRAYKRIKAVFDTQEGSPRVIYWKSMTHFGWPLEQDILSELRTGGTLAAIR
ncbi:MAG TPA: type II secretion system protein GspK [Anaerohalosphaeraceae bacterium]|jgi:type II secretory pathway component PulK|nr:type II secretion system protein GspK [Anaerohalosphaeraceae bacterium]HRT49099.1 type II secretion system protein GspK [Anaerohalosphaeraceae bacterium]HRT85648.1 type II secretion system protein GspK [Anaerohalosphaeraceae bacterium]